MAGAGKKTFTAGEVLTASDVNTYLMEQSVMVFGGTAARSSAIPTPTTGMTSYQTDKKQLDSYNGSAWVGMGGLQLIKTQEIGTGVSSVTVTNAFSATYDNYRIIVSGGVTSNNDIYLALRLGASTTNYYYSLIFATYAGGSPANAAGSNVNRTDYVGAGSLTNGLVANVEVNSPYLAKYTGISAPFTGFGASGGNLNAVHGISSSYTDFTLFASAGTITGGTIAVYGYAK